MRDFIETIFEEELEAALWRGRHERKSERATGYRDGHRDREIVGTFGPETIRVPRARIAGADGKTTEWRSQALPRYRRLTRKAEELIVGAYLAGTNTRRVKRALSTLFAGAVGKDVVSRAWRKVKTDWEAWAARNLSGEDIVRFGPSLGRIAFGASLLDGTVVKAHIDKRATAIPIFVTVGARRDGQKVLIGLKNMGGETTAAWRAFLEDLSARGLRELGFVIVDGAPWLEAALAGLWPDAPVQRCTVHKHRNLLAHVPKRLHDELTEHYRDMIYAETAVEIERRRTAFLRKWRRKCRAVAKSLEEAGKRLFTFTRLPPGQWKLARKT